MKTVWRERAIRQRTLFYKLFFSFIVFLLIPVFLFSTISYSGVLKYSQEKVENVNMAKLQLVENNIDAVFIKVSNSAFRLIQDDNIKKLFELDDEDLNNNFQNVSKVMDAYNVFNEVIKNNPGIKSIYIYDQSKDLIIKSYEGIFKRSEFYDTDWIEPYIHNSIDDESLTGIRSPINSQNINNNTIGNTTLYNSMKKEKVITYILPLKYMQIKGIIAINIAANSFVGNFTSTSENEEESYIAVDENGNIVYGGNKRIKNAETFIPIVIRDVMKKEADNSGSYLLPNGEKKYLVMFRRSSVSNLTIINVILLSELYDKIFFFETLLAISVILTLVFGIILAYILSTRLYNPVKKVLENLKNQVMIDPRYKRNELSIISDAINELVENGRKADQIIEMDKQNLKESYILGLVMGKMEENDNRDFLEDYCCCILLSIDRYETFSAQYSYREQYYYKSLVLKVCNQVVALYLKGAGAIMETDKIVLVVSTQSETLHEFSQKIKTICDAVISEISAIKDFSISVGIGGIYMNRESIRKSFLEASKALKYRLLFGYKCTVNYNEISNYCNVYKYPFDKESNIINNLKLNSEQEVFDTVQEMVEDFRCFETKKMNCEIVMQIVSQLVGKTMEYLAAAYINTDDVFGVNYNVNYELTGQETLEDIRQWLDLFYERIIAYQKIHAQNADENTHFKDIINIINKYYTDSNLCIEAIADQLNLSYSHVRKIFKDFSGVNFVDYLNKMRVESAKELLLKTDFTIKDIANKSGYNNDQCLTRFFKRYEGVTPGKYRMNWSDTIKE